MSSHSHPKNAPFWLKIRYIFANVFADFANKKLGTALTILVISVSLTLPTVSYLLWKNVSNAASQFSPQSDLTIYLHKNLNEDEANQVVEKIRQQKGVASLHYISRQESLNQFRAWSGFAEELDVLDDNPLPAVVMIKPEDDFNSLEGRHLLQENINKIKGVQEVKLDNDWAEKLNALTWLIERVALCCATLMLIAVFLVVGNSVRADVFHNQKNIAVMKLLGATDQFILRPFLVTGMLYGLCGALLASIWTLCVIGYFTTAVQYVTDIFAVSFNLYNLNLSEFSFLLIFCCTIGYVAAWLAASRHIKLIEN